MRLRGAELTTTTFDRATSAVPSARLLVPALGITQLLAWGSSYYLLAVIAKPVAADTGWPLTWIVAGLSLGLLVAGLVSPFVGRRIHARGGRPVLAGSALLFGAGLLGLAAAPDLPIFILSWAVIGLGMAAGLYDAAFSTLGRLYGLAARPYITTVTLFGGLASTACWPLSAFLLSEFGWRGVCVTYAAIHLLFCLPVYLLTLSTSATNSSPGGARSEAPSETLRGSGRGTIFGLLALVIMTGSSLSALISVHLLTILQSHGITLAGAVALGATVGPAQVGARFIEMLVGRYHHPIWTMVVSVSLVGVALGLLWTTIPIVPVALVLYGAGIGLGSIARATLPLSLFGAAHYAPLMGRLARPNLMAQAAAPALGALLIQNVGSENAMGVIAVVAFCNLGLALALATMTSGQWRSSR